jgi:3-deoxy-D-manno-octulosonic-acid transferase
MMPTANQLRAFPGVNGGLSFASLLMPAIVYLVGPGTKRRKAVRKGLSDILGFPMRRFYSLLLYLLTPLILAYLAFRGLRAPDYLRRWNERFGRFKPPAQSGGILVHAVSMGEVNAAAPLVRELAARYPGSPMTVTAFTPTGSERIRSLFGEDVFHVFSPLDLPGSVRRFLDRVQPRVLVIMETEIWPNLYHQAAARNIPILIVNARISRNSIGGYRRFSGLVADVLSETAAIAAQSEEDAGRLIELGADDGRVSVTGNLKFDVRLPPSLVEQGESIRTAWGTDRLVLLAGSSHEADETAVFKAFQGILDSHPTALLVLVPRHPERFMKAAHGARAAGFRVSLRSESASCARDTQCYVVDAMGELLRYYAACDIAVVGGSFERIGGHNPLEPAALARPVLLGPHTFNFADITRQMLEHGAALQFEDGDELAAAVRELAADPGRRDRMGQAGLALVRSGQGALERTLEVMEPWLTRAGC